MLILNLLIKYARGPLILGGLIICGCTTLPEQKNIWPWEYGRGQGEPNTGDYATFRAGIANFSEPPKKVTPVKPESITPHPAEQQSAAIPPAAKTEPSAVGDQRKEKATRGTNEGYNFSVHTRKNLIVDSLLLDNGSATYDIIAANDGNAPVAVAINLESGASHNITSDHPLPYSDVVPAHTERTLMQLSAKNKQQGFIFSYNTSWSLGDYNAIHNCPEQYLIPFSEKIRAFASVSNTAEDSPYTRYAVIFSVPKKTPVLPARKGVVVQISPNGKVDILHEDATIGTYYHLERINDYVVVGKAVTTDDIIGIAATSDNDTMAFIQLAVWRPEPQSSEHLQAGTQLIRFEGSSFPLAFKSAGAEKAKVLAKNQPVSRGALHSSKKQVKRR